ncbi:glycosyltransferase [Paenibacillus profundus]|uniref:Glycosyltransferase n=1 Tax=Paenibacillus profundus TaxID=1173085 RepID=A0ABS8YIL8_9BACL|nr:MULTISPECIES: glycosyltransferase [Paenibacillus]MCE5170166.1 glycosyltransferase [Paenibacillus profundus]
MRTFRIRRRRRIRTGVVHPREHSRRQGRKAGFEGGYQEGYLRGRADYIVNTTQAQVSSRPLHVLYVSTGKGYPYSPLDEGIISTFQGMVGQLSVAGPRDPVAATAVQLRPDLVVALDGMDFPAEQVDEIRAHGIRTALWITDDPYYTSMMADIVTHYDYVFTLEANSVPFYQGIGANAHYLPFAAFPGQFRPIKTRSPLRQNLTFIGSAYWNRVKSIEPILPQLMKRNIVISGLWWDRLSEFRKYAHQIQLGRWMDPQETAASYNGTKIVINMHRAHDDDSVNQNSANITAASPNPRTFEICSCGTLQLTDVRDDLARFYTPGEEIETYSSPEEMLDKIDYYLSHEQERREIALRGLARTLRDHTYANRLNQMLSIVFG